MAGKVKELSTEQKRAKILVTGATGFLGSHLMNNLSIPALADIPVVGMYHTHKPPKNKHSYRQCDITNEQQLLRTLKEEKPDIIVHLAAMSDASFCQHNPQESEQMNVAVTRYLVEYSRSEEVGLLFASSDLVFDGTKGNYQEADAVNPLMRYGEQKAKAEELVLSLGGLSMVCRLSMMYGAVQPHHSNFTAHMIRQLRAGKEIELFTDEYRSVASASTVASALLLLCHSPHSGICHVAGPDRLSRYEFGCIVADKLGLDKSLIHPGLSASLHTAVKRPLDVSMNCGLLKSHIGVQLLSAHEAENTLRTIVTPT